MLKIKFMMTIVNTDLQQEVPMDAEIKFMMTIVNNTDLQQEVPMDAEIKFMMTIVNNTDLQGPHGQLSL